MKMYEYIIHMMILWHHQAMDNLLAGMEGVLGRTGPNFLRELLITIDELFIRRLLLKDPDAVQDKITGAYHNISLQFVLLFNLEFSTLLILLWMVAKI